jgi:hypothetical protein
MASDTKKNKIPGMEIYRFDQRRPIMADKQVDRPLTLQHPNPFCNFWNGPIGGPGCICTGNVSGISATSQTIYSCRHGASSQPCQICKGVAEFDAQFDPLRREIAQLRKRVTQLEGAIVGLPQPKGGHHERYYAGWDEAKFRIQVRARLSSTATEKTEDEK